MIDIGDAGEFYKAIPFMDSCIELYALSDEPSNFSILGCRVSKG